MSDTTRTPYPVAVLCQEYTRLRCYARMLARLDLPLYAELLRDVSGFMLDEAPDEALADLDTIKRIFEIDMLVANPDVVLMRASVQRPVEPIPEPDPEPEPTEKPDPDEPKAESRLPEEERP
jgi:hypothetical protein